ncbi:MAG: stimulus-sensing domain-containing protein [Alphaproteobacteria bacterium]
MKNSTKSKHYTESDTATAKNSRWFRISSPRGEIEQLFDLYWGGKERRITGMTLRIIGVNLIALISLLIGVISLGQYHETLIESKLQRFETEILLITATFVEKFKDQERTEPLSSTEVDILTARLGATLNRRILIFNAKDDLIADSEHLIEEKKIEPIIEIAHPVHQAKRKLESVELLKNTALWIVSLLPREENLPVFLGVQTDKGYNYSDVREAKRKNLSMSAWRDTRGEIILTAAMPIMKHNDELVGVVMLINNGEDIKQELGDVWFNILNVFLLTLLITILLSIYLSGVIARPLRKLARAAENVRKGKIKDTDIPDMSDRHDEIGELSLVLRDMTHALWERMDSIESFASDVSHEIKNPLTSLKSAVETASIVTKQEDRDKLLSVIKHDIERLDRLITDISNASRLDAELSREMFNVVNIKDILRHLIDMYKSPLEREADNKQNSDEALKDGILITLDLPDYAELFVRGSEGRLIQVFHNILSNALSFSPVKSTIKISVSVKVNRVTVTIDDEGSGIPENKLKSIFERFYSERPQHEEYGRHSGLGLSICKQIITAHGGLIYAENRQDRKDIKGARFSVVLNLIDGTER